MAGQGYAINLWINEERYERLHEAGLAGLARDVLAGLKVVQVEAAEDEKDILLARYPSAKFDSSTTGTIELLPRPVKDRLFDLLLEYKTTRIVGHLLKSSDAGNTR